MIGTQKIVFSIGVSLLKVLAFTLVMLCVFKILAAYFFEIHFSDEQAVILGLFFLFALVAYDYLSAKFEKLMQDLNTSADQKEAINVFERHGLKVALLRTDLPKDSNYDEDRECIQAYATLQHQQIPFVLIKPNNDLSGKLYFLGESGKNNHNKYSFTLKQDSYSGSLND